MNILLVSYYYPPPASGGSERSRAMARHLPRLGHRVRVLTRSYRGSDFSDPGCIRIFDLSQNNNRSGLNFPLWLSCRFAVELLSQTGIYASIFSLWRRNVLRQAGAIIAAERPDVIIATYPPAENLEIGIHIAKQEGIPLIADFRDGLLFEPIESKNLEKFPSIRRHYQRLEKEVMEAAAAVTTVSPPLSEYFSRQYRHPDVSTIPNGFEAEELAMPPLCQWELAPGRFHLVHTGGFARSDAGCDISSFVQALYLLKERGGEAAQKLSIHLAGRLSRREKRLLDGLLRSGTVKHYGTCDRKLALALQRKADLLLLITAAARTSVATSKIFEYLGAGKPILALTGRTYAAQLVAETGSGWTALPDDAGAIAELLLRIIVDRSFYSSLKPDREKIASFSREKQMRNLDLVLQRLDRNRKNE